MACNPRKVGRRKGDASVSIPGGFFRGLQRYRLGRLCQGRLRFQSLAGFFVACNEGCSSRTPASRRSFNPWRVFSWLATLRSRRRPGRLRGVSIPGGFFRGLQQKPDEHARPTRPRFQSLAGFFVACNNETDDLDQPTDMLGFNPWRVFSWLATSILGRYWLSGHLVSIPGGFFRGLQQVSDPRSPGMPAGFNPWRVFSWLATSRRSRLR